EVRSVARSGWREQQRLDEWGPHQLLRVAACQRASTRALARRRSHGTAAADGPPQARPAARCGEERTAPELRQRSVRSRVRNDPRGALPGDSSVLTLDDRVHDRSECGVARGREELLPHVLRTEQRDALDRRRLPARFGEEARPALLWRHSARAGTATAPPDHVTASG